MQENYLYFIIFLLFLTIAILGYVMYIREKEFKELRKDYNAMTLNQQKKSSPRPLIFDRNNSAYTSTDTKNYYRAATIPERRWQKVGVLTTDDKTMNLLARPSTYNEDIWQYRAEDKDGFIIELGESQAYRTNDVIPSIPGKASAGAWTVRIYSRDTYYL
jgi:cell division protein FtsI/penicillin-binding protein 2